MDKWRTVQREIVHTRKSEPITAINIFMQDVYATLQKNGYTLSDVPLEEATQDIKEKIFAFCISVMR